jgi:PAS domain-containing protein
VLSRAVLDPVLESTMDDMPEAQVAFLDLELQHVACTKSYAVQLGYDRSGVLGETIESFISEPVPMYEALEGVLAGELDFRTLDVLPLTANAPVTLHVAMVRGEDATPLCIVVVAQPVPQLAAVLPPGA